MPAGLLPLFPLQVVVFPRMRLPLHIFEDRYKEMVNDAVRDNSEFGIVLARDEGIVNAGCTVVVEKVTEVYPDGRMDILTAGRRRFEILRLNEEKDYLQAEVQFFDDDEPGPAPDEDRRQALAHYAALQQLREAETAEAPDPADPQLSFQLATAIPDLDFLNVLLRTRSEPARIRELNGFCAKYIPQQQAVARVRHLAPLNGRGGNPAGIS